MVKQPLNLIVACTENRVIGRDGRRPWRIPEDLEHFHRHTANTVVVMGRICYQTWPQAGIEGRRPVVVTSKPELVVGSPPSSREAGLRKGTMTPLTARNLSSALEIAAIAADEAGKEIFICGGQRIYEETLALKRPLRLYLTLIHATMEGDRYFPEWRGAEWKETGRREGADENFKYTFLTLETK